jgi:GxxExxY protein
MKLQIDKPESDGETGRILAAFFYVYNRLGWGFLEIVYRRSLARVLRRAGADVQEEAPQEVHFEGAIVGEYRADLCVNGCVIVEVKAVDRLIPVHRAQLINYLRASRIERGLLLNFGPRPEVKRVIMTNDRKCLADPPLP